MSINPERLIPTVVSKGWGEEVWMINCPKYCGKLLKFKDRAKFSMHFHMEKDETWYVLSGNFTFRWIHGETADIIEEELKEGDCVHIPTHLPHQLESNGIGIIIETSTEHKDEDSLRVWKGDSQQIHKK